MVIYVVCYERGLLQIGQSVGIIERYQKIQNCICIKQNREETYNKGLFLMKIIIQQVQKHCFCITPTSI